MALAVLRTFSVGFIEILKRKTINALGIDFNWIVWFAKWLWVHTNFDQGSCGISVKRLLAGGSIVHHNSVVLDKWAHKFNQVPFDLLSTICLLACNFMETQLKKVLKPASISYKFVFCRWVHLKCFMVLILEIESCLK